MRFDRFSFGSLEIDGSSYEHDVLIDRGEISKRKKKPSKKFREQFGHTPLSVEENIPWKCRQLVIGNGAYGRLPVMQEVEVNRAEICYEVCWATNPSHAILFYAFCRTCGRIGSRGGRISRPFSGFLVPSSLGREL